MPAKRGICVFATILVLAGLALADWPWFNGPNRNGTAVPAKRLTRWPAVGPKVLWTVQLGQGFGGPAVRDGAVYVLDRVPRTRDMLRCLALADGKERWRFSYPAPGKFSHGGSRQVPAVDGRYVFAIGPLGHFHCVDRKTGKKVWAKNLLEDFDGERPGWAVAQSPLLYKDWVIVAPLGKKAGVIACEKATGKIVWQSAPLSGMQYASPLLTTIGGVEQVVILSGAAKNTRIDGLDVNNGKVLWTYTDWQCRIPIPNVTCVGDGRMFITAGYKAGSAMFRVTKTGGGFQAKTLFKTNQCGSQVHPALLHEGHLYANSNSNSRSDGLLCMDLRGKVKWKTGKNPNFERGNLILADGLIYNLDGKTGFLHLIRPTPDAYQEISKAKLLSGKEIWSPMALAGRYLVIRDQKQMKCLDVGSE